MAMIMVETINEVGNECPRGADGAESFREHRSVFQGFEPALAERVIVRDPGPGVRAGDLKIGQ